MKEVDYAVSLLPTLITPDMTYGEMYMALNKAFEIAEHIMDRKQQLKGKRK